jgi:DUF4097 and DUF4098 domain-containing protein YvlB
MRALGWAAAGVLIGVGTLSVAGCDWGGQNTEVHTYTVSGTPTRLSVENHLGRIEVVAGDGPIQVTETWRFHDTKPTTKHAVDGDTLRLSESGCVGHGHACQVDYKVRVPAATAVTATDTAGSMTLTGLTGDIDVTDSAGGIEGTGLGAKNTVVRDSAGSIKLSYTAVPDSVDAHDSAGAITIHVPDSVAYHVDAHTTAGKTSVEVPQDQGSPHRIVAQDTAGSITISRA